MTSASPLMSTELPVLRPYIEAGLFNEMDVQLSETTARLAHASGHEFDLLVPLAVAAVSRGLRSGHVHIDLARVAELLLDERTIQTDLPWPDTDSWITALSNASALVATPDTVDEAPVRPLVLDGTHLYLQRYWTAETRVAKDLLQRSASISPIGFDPETLEEALTRFFGPEQPTETDWQKVAARAALSDSFSVLAGGPGTGKTRTVARMLATAYSLAGAEGRNLMIGLAAPSGKAAARMGEAIEAAVIDLLNEDLIDETLATKLRGARPLTIHRLLGANPRGDFRHDRSNPLALDILVIDEASMVSLPLMGSLLAALPIGCHLMLVGDPDQLASVQAGTVLGDIVHPAINEEPGTTDMAANASPERSVGSDGPSSGAHGTLREDQITVLRINRRFGADSAIAMLANAVRQGDSDRVLQILSEEHDDITWIRPDDQEAVLSLVRMVGKSAVEAVKTAKSGDVDEALQNLTATKVLTATRYYDLGLHDWSRRVESHVYKQVGRERIRIGWSDWYIGRPVLITRNDLLLDIANGDVGITVDRNGVATVVLDRESQSRPDIQAAKLDDVETWWAMTIHKSQGSEFDHAIVSLPPVEIPILTRELLYTGITRAKKRVTVVGSEVVIRTGVERRISRASGLQERLWSIDDAAPRPKRHTRSVS